MTGIKNHLLLWLRCLMNIAFLKLYKDKNITKILLLSFEKSPNPFLKQFFVDKSVRPMINLFRVKDI